MRSTKQKQPAQTAAPQNPYIRIGQLEQELKDARNKERAALESYSLLEKAVGFNPIISIEEITPEGQAYRFLAEGIVAVLELNSTPLEFRNLLYALVTELWNDQSQDDITGMTRHWLAHVAETQARAYREQPKVQFKAEAEAKAKEA